MKAMANLAALAIAVSLLTGCGGSQAAEEDLQPALDALASEIDQMIGTASCDQTDQCRVIGFGHKPCGGPRGYRPYSVVGTDVTLLQATVERFNQLQAELHARLRIASDCALVLQPGVQCLSGKCVTQ